MLVCPPKVVDIDALVEEIKNAREKDFTHNEFITIREDDLREVLMNSLEDTGDTE